MIPPPPLLVPSTNSVLPLMLAPYCWNSSPARTLLLLLYPPLWFVDLSSVTPSRSIALPSWPLSDALNRCSNLRDRTSGYGGTTASVFSPVVDPPFSAHRSPFRVFEPAVYLVFGSLLKGLGLSLCMFLCFVSLRVWGIMLGSRRGRLFPWPLDA